MTWPGNEHRVQVALADCPVGVHVDEVEAGYRAEVTE
jgi:hypothetical protein